MELDNYTCDLCIMQKLETVTHLFISCNFAKSCSASIGAPFFHMFVKLFFISINFCRSAPLQLTSKKNRTSHVTFVQQRSLFSITPKLAEHLTMLNPNLPVKNSITRIISKGSIFGWKNLVAQREEQHYFHLVPCGGRACWRTIRLSRQQLVGGGSGPGAPLWKIGLSGIVGS